MNTALCTASPLPPEAAGALRAVEGAVWLEPRLRALVEIRTAQLNGAVENLLRHARAAVELGESQHRLAALAGGRGAAPFTARERAALALAEALALPHDREAVAAARADAEEHFGPRELAHVVLACIAANASDRLELAFGPAAGAAGRSAGERAA